MSQADFLPPVETTTLLEDMQQLILYREILQAQRLIYQFKTPKMTSKIILLGPRKFGGMQTAYTIWTGMTRSSLAFQQWLRVMKQSPITARLLLRL
jgi:hypothetical protein